MTLYLLLADLQNTALSALLIFSERILYPTYAAVPADFSPTEIPRHIPPTNS
jgi:hypothetical protein